MVTASVYSALAFPWLSVRHCMPARTRHRSKRCPRWPLFLAITSMSGMAHITSTGSMTAALLPSREHRRLLMGMPEESPVFATLSARKCVIVKSSRSNTQSGSTDRVRAGVSRNEGRYPLTRDDGSSSGLPSATSRGHFVSAIVVRHGTAELPLAMATPVRELMRTE
jgi:hypothetical protein